MSLTRFFKQRGNATQYGKQNTNYFSLQKEINKLETLVRGLKGDELEDEIHQLEVAIKEVKKTHPVNPQIHLVHGMLLERTNKKAEALKEFHAASQSASLYRRGYMYEAELLYQMGSFNECKKVLLNMVKRFNSASSAQKNALTFEHQAEMYAMLGKVCLKLGEKNASLAYVQKALAADPTSHLAKSVMQRYQKALQTEDARLVKSGDQRFLSNRYSILPTNVSGPEEDFAHLARLKRR
ncbi:tetratricopeptide repeat protein [Aquicella lusitana]|jgi:hypothetical protein|uniref:Tetratricopeptide repeat protein n=1 Tax=Aquicella lusitana TaxID=254246 RepID=A0A370GDL7_9COXI|nr:hypothetical protein [Aquicella lusitana]RDI40073.1 tetratricopeptide repeat protein [Aquicella lusitana]VVC72353.1 hypothetical protein AQULUS_00630 [Aquicella lusitana]